jgi:hypothetical protein
MSIGKSIQAIESDEPAEGYRKRNRRWGVAVKVLPPEKPLEYALYNLAETIRDETRRTVIGIVTIGRCLTEAQALLKGEERWVSWLKDEFEWSHQTAYNFINAAALVGRYPDLLKSDMPPSVLYLLSGAPESVVQDVITQAEEGNLTKGKALAAVRAAKWKDAVSTLIESDPGAAFHEIEKKMNEAAYHEAAVALYNEHAELFAALSSEDESTVAQDLGIPLEERYPDLKPDGSKLPPGCQLEENGECLKIIVWADGQPYVIATFPRNLPPVALAYRNAALVAVTKRLEIKTWEETI